MCSSCLTWQSRRRKLQEYCSILPLQCSSKNDGNILVFRIFDTFVNHLCNIEHQSVGEAQIKMQKWKNQKQIFHFRFLFPALPQLSLCLEHTHKFHSVYASTIYWLGQSLGFACLPAVLPGGLSLILIKIYNVTVQGLILATSHSHSA